MGIGHSDSLVCLGKKIKMDIKNAFIGLWLTGIALLLTVLTAGMLLPFMTPVFMYGLTFLGVKME